MSEIAILRLDTKYGEVFIEVNSNSNCYIRERRVPSAKSKDGLRTVKARNLYASKDSFGYMSFNIAGKRYKVHRIVAKAHIPNPDNKPCVNHIDGDKENNRASNLEWVSYSENEYHSHNVLGKKVHNKIIEGGFLREIVEALSDFKVSTVARITGIKRPTIQAISSGRNHQRETGIPTGFTNEVHNELI